MRQEAQIEKLDLIPESGDLFLFRSSTINSLYPSVEASSRKCLNLLNYKIIESDDQTCCTDPLYYSNLETDVQMTAIMARNLSVMGQHTKNIVTECNGCFSTLIQAQKNLHKPAIRDRIAPIITKLGYKIIDDLNIFHIVELYYKILPKIQNMRKFDLSGLRIASHYGCNYLRTHPDSIITDAQMPDILEAIIAKCGGTPVYYTERDCCCGAGITQRHTNPDLSLEVSYQKMKSLSKDPPDLLLSICPFCMSTLENCQFNIEIEKDLELSIPVLHVSELIALVLGFDPIADLSLDSHTINPIPPLKNISPIENT